MLHIFVGTFKKKIFGSTVPLQGLKGHDPPHVLKSKHSNEIDWIDLLPEIFACCAWPVPLYSNQYHEGRSLVRIHHNS